MTISCSITDQVGSYFDELFFRFALPGNREKKIVVLRYVKFFLNDEIVNFLQPTSPYKPRIKESVDDFSFSETLPGIKVG